MKPQVVEPSLPSLDALSGVESLCLFVTEDERPLQGAAGFVDWRLCGALSRALGASFFQGHPDERLLMPTAGRVPAQRVFAVGLGRQKQVTALGLEHALTRAAQMLGKAQVSLGGAGPAGAAGARPEAAGDPGPPRLLRRVRRAAGGGVRAGRFQGPPGRLNEAGSAHGPRKACATVAFA